MRVPIIMPQLGESIAEATIVRLAVQPGEQVAADQEIIEVETQKALLHVTSPCAGRIAEFTAEAQGTYEVGATLGYIESVPEGAARPSAEAPGDGDQAAMLDVEPGQPAPGANGHGHGYAAPAPAPPELRSELPSDGASRASVPAISRPVSPSPAAVAGRGLPVPARLGGAGYASPRLKARLSELGLGAADLAAVPGTGAGGRVTVEDLEKFVTELDARPTQPAPAMRVAVGDAMRRSWTRPLATVGRGARLDALLAHRKTQTDPKPGVVLYVIRALALALAGEPALSGRLIGKRLVPAAGVHIGFAVEVDDGLMVPVLRGVDGRRVDDLNAEYQELVAAARRRQLPGGATGGAAATVTNFGTFGLTWATPIPLPEESLMLGLGAGRKVPVWDEEQAAFVPVTEAEITLSFDHRTIDGGGAGRLLAHVARLLAEPGNL